MKHRGPVARERHEAPRFAIAAALAALLCAALAPPPAAARPSLIDLDADLTQVIDGLCGGDPATCGTTPALPVAGQIDFDGQFQVDFVSLRFGYDKPMGGAFAFRRTAVMLDRTSVTTALFSGLLTATNYSAVTVQVPDPVSPPGNTVILTLEDAKVRSVDTGSGPQPSLELEFRKATYSWLGSVASWTTQFGVGNGCTVPSGLEYIALAGNSPGLLNPGELEASYGFGSSVPTGGGSASFSFSFGGTPDAQSPCYLRTTGNAGNVDADFHRLHPDSDALGMQLREETLDLTTSVVTSYELLIEGTSLSETTVVAPGSGELRTTTFDAMGNPTGTTKQIF